MHADGPPAPVGSYDAAAANRPADLPAGTGSADGAAPADPVATEMRRAFAAHPDLIYGARERAEAIHAAYARLRADHVPAEDSLAFLAARIAALPAILGREAPGLQCGGVIALRVPAIFLRTADPLLAAVIDACGSGSYAHRVHPWVLRACFADPDQENPTDFPYLFGPAESDWRTDRAGCLGDAWRIAFGIHLFGVSRDHEGRPRPDARALRAGPRPGRGTRGPDGPSRPSAPDPPPDPPRVL